MEDAENIRCAQRDEDENSRVSVRRYNDNHLNYFLGISLNTLCTYYVSDFVSESK